MKASRRVLPVNRRRRSEQPGLVSHSRSAEKGLGNSLNTAASRSRSQEIHQNGQTEDQDPGRQGGAPEEEDDGDHAGREPGHVQVNTMMGLLWAENMLDREIYFILSSVSIFRSR